MAFVVLDNVEETTTTSGTGPYTLNGAADASVLTFDSPQLANGDQTFYSCWDPAGQIEVGIGTFVAGPPRQMQRTAILFSTSGGSPVTWGASGTRNIAGVIPGVVLSDLLDPTKTGIIVRKTAAEHVFRTLAVDGTGHLSLQNADGTAGNPTIVTTALDTRFLRRDIAATMVGKLTLSATSSRISGFTGTPLVHLIEGQSGENAIRLRRVAASDYLWEVWSGGAGGAWGIVPAITPANPGDDGKHIAARGGTWGIEENYLSGYDEDADATNLSVSITIPAYGVWDLKAVASLKVDNTSGANYGIIVNGQIKKGAAVVEEQENSAMFGQSGAAGVDVTVTHFERGIAAGSSTWTVALNVTNGTFATHDKTTTGRNHTLEVQAFKRQG